MRVRDFECAKFFRPVQCSLANPADPTNTTYIVCEDLGSGIWKRSDMQCPANTIFYQDVETCLDVCWTDETINEMCRAIEQGQSMRV